MLSHFSKTAMRSSGRIVGGFALLYTSLLNLSQTWTISDISCHRAGQFRTSMFILARKFLVTYAVWAVAPSCCKIACPRLNVAKQQAVKNVNVSVSIYIPVENIQIGFIELCHTCPDMKRSSTPSVVMICAGITESPVRRRHTLFRSSDRECRILDSSEKKTSPLPSCKTRVLT